MRGSSKILFALICAGELALAQDDPRNLESLPIEAFLATGVTEDNEAVNRTITFPDDIKSFFLVLAAGSFDDYWIRVNVNLVVDSAERLEPGRTTRLFGGGLIPLQPSQRVAREIVAPSSGPFGPGRYHIEITSQFSEYAPLLVPFEIVPAHSSTELLRDIEPRPRGFNVARRAFGASIVVPQDSRAADAAPVSLLSGGPSNWSAVNLIDGFAATTFYSFGSYICRSCGWRADAKELPYDIEIQLAGEEAPIIGAVVLEPYSGPPLLYYDPQPPRYVEIAVSDGEPGGPFQTVATVRMRPEAAEQIVRFLPVRARHLRLRLLDTFGENAYLGEIRVIEASAPNDSVLANVPRNLASPDLGGVLVYVTSGKPAAVVDGEATAEAAGSWEVYPVTLPQDFVFAFRDDHVALIDKVEINPASRSLFGNDPNWPSEISIAVSTSAGPTDFREVGRYPLEPVAADQSFPVSAKARYLRLRLLSTHDTESRSVTLGEVRIIEGTAPDYESVLVEYKDPVANAFGSGADPEAPASGAVESEPNDSAADATQLRLSEPIHGRIEPHDDVDQYRLAIDASATSTLLLDLHGSPHIKTAINLYSSTGMLMKSFDPSGATASRERLSWRVEEAGEYRLEVTQAPATVVLLWDTSGSMRGSEQDLEAAVRRFVELVEPWQRVNMIRFGNGVEVLLPDFTGDRAVLSQALEGKFLADGGTPLFDAMVKGFELLENVAGNRVIVLVSDAADSGGLSQQAFWESLEASGVRVYAIGLGEAVRVFDRDFGTTGERALKQIAAATGGEALFTTDSKELEALYERVSNDLRAAAIYTIEPTVTQNKGTLLIEVIGEANIPSVSAPSQVALILDASGSMRRELSGRRMIDSAKDVLDTVIGGLPDDSQVALRVFGHRINEGLPGDCEDTELLVPFSRLDRGMLRERLSSVAASGGTTLISHALRQLSEDFGNTPGRKLVVLVTDGEEECEPDLHAAVRAIQEQGVEIHLNVVGFALAEEALKEQLAALAAQTGGKFFDAVDPSALEEEMRQALAVPYEILDSSGDLAASGLIGAETSVPEGRYTLRLRLGGGDLEIPDVTIHDAKRTQIELQLDGEEINFRLSDD